jgi:general L-amino acid transport system substrate-binding protein
MGATDAFGDLYRNMFQDAIAVVGDYGHLYDLYLENFVPRSPTNHINNGTSPNMFAIPVGNTLSGTPPSSTDSQTIAAIKTRGRLNCGITDTPFFATLSADNEWVGLDIDFCNGIAAGLFDGEFQDKVEFVQLNPDARFDALASGKVDVLARATTITFERDVKEKSVGIGFTFSFPNFYDSIKFAGMPELVKCAENRDSTSHRCSALHICFTSNTTQSDLVAVSFPQVPKTLSKSTSRNVASLKGGACNVLVGGSADIFELRSQKWFEEKSYVVGTKHLSRESLALVTRDNDPLWSKFVNWVVLATIHAEEKNITQETYWDMPHVNLFGPTVDEEMLRDVIRAVGSYGEIWQRHATFSNFLEREGRNLLAANTNDTSPLLRSDLFWDDP